MFEVREIDDCCAGRLYPAVGFQHLLFDAVPVIVIDVEAFEDFIPFESRASEGVIDEGHCGIWLPSCCSCDPVDPLAPLFNCVAILGWIAEPEW